MKLSLILLFLSGLFLQGCTLASPFIGPKYDKKSGRLTLPPDQTVVMAITNAKLDRKTRRGFDKSSEEIYSTIDKYDGYVGGSVRFRILDEEVWTMTLWEDQKSLKNFVDSRQHLDAMYMTNQAMKQFRHFNIELPARDLPYSWSQVEEMLENREWVTHTPF